MNNMNILLLASEITKGMKSMGPKCLLKLNSDISILDYQINQAQLTFKNCNIVILTGFENDRVKKHIENNYQNIRIICDESYATYNQTNAILTAMRALGPIDNILIIGSGVLLKQYPKIKNNAESTLFYLNKNKDNFNIGSFDTDGTQYLFYGLPNVWAECVFLDKKTIDIMSTLDKKKFGQLYLFETINQLLETYGVNFVSHVIDKKNIFKVLSHKDIKKAKRFYAV